MTSRHPKTAEEIQKELQAIYQEKDGELPNLQELEPVRRSRLTIWLVRTIGVLAVLSTVSWLGFWLWNRGVFHSPNLLETTMEGPRDVRSGEATRFMIRYQNMGNVPIAALEMKLNLPADFLLVTSTPAATDGDLTWTLGSLTPGSDGSVVIEGIFRSEVPSSSTFQSYFTYRPANFSSEFQDIETLSVNVRESGAIVAVTGPEKTLSGDEIVYTVHVQNTTTNDLADLNLSLALPKDFVLKSVQPPATSLDTSSWSIPKLGPGELFALTLTGHYTASAGGEQKVEAQMGFVADGATLPQAVGMAITDVVGSTIAFHLIANGSAMDLVEELGDSLHISADYANTSNETLSDVVFTLSFEPVGKKALPIVWPTGEKAETAFMGGRRKGSAIVWDKISVPNLARLAPRASGVFDFRLPLTDTFDRTAQADAFMMKLTVAFAQVGSKTKRHTIETSPLQVAINSDLEAMATARYFTEDGETLGTGPLPPKVGQTTTYRIEWLLANSLHSLKETVLTTTLPSDVTWTTRNETSHGTIAYDPTTRVVRWSIDTLAAVDGGARASFEVAVTPRSSDLGSFVRLTNAASVEAIDTVTQATLNRGLDSLTTELPEDETAARKGIVVP